MRAMQAGNRRETGEVTKKHSVEKQALGPLRVSQTAEDGTSVLALQGNAEGLVKPLDNHAGRLASTASNESPQAAPGAHCHRPPPTAAGLSNQGEELNALISALLRGLQMGSVCGPHMQDRAGLRQRRKQARWPRASRWLLRDPGLPARVSPSSADRRQLAGGLAGH